VTPKISVGIPVYNGARFLDGALASVAAQDFEGLEVVICDNASIDNTGEICRSYSSRDPRFKYHRNPQNIGAAPNFNRAFELSSGDFFAWLAYDDELCPGMLRACWEAFAKNGPETAMVYPQCELIDENGAPIQRGRDHIASSVSRAHQRLGKVLMRVGSGHPIYGLMRRTSLARTQRMQSVVSNDYILLGELAMVGKIVEVDGVLFRYRHHPDNSRVKYKNIRELEVWFDPRNEAKRIRLPETASLVRNHLNSVFAVPLTLPDRILCAATVLAVTGYRRGRNYLGREKARVRASLGKAPITHENSRHR
jgi:glycosyltransferase involved in cell wall biosynthesis